jgi:plasmid stabilization system protein ParE
VKPVRYHPVARAELREAVRFGEMDRPGRGAALEAAVRKVVWLIHRLPESSPAWRGLPPALEIRRARVRRYPYLVIYEVWAEQVVIVAVAHTSLRPGYWLDRILPSDLLR